MLKRVYDLKSQTEVFLEMDAEIFPSSRQSRLEVEICDDVNFHVNGMNDNLQGANRLVNVMRHK
jgi:hypothetical protein